MAAHHHGGNTGRKGNMLNISHSLKKQILLSTMVLLFIGISLYTALTVYHAIRSGDARIHEYRDELMTRKKEELNNYTDMVFRTIEGLWPDQIVAVVKHARYGETGYFWINDTTLPYPKMIMHPTIPELDGKVLNDPKFNCAQGKSQNLFQAFAEVSLAKGEGYVDYLWPKPIKSGLTQEMPKLSYVRLYRPLNWVIGTGVYIDDIDTLVANEKLRMKNEVSAVITNSILIAASILISFYFIFSKLFDNYAGKPLRQITHTFQNYDNDLTAKIQITAKNEIGELARAFNLLTANLLAVIKNVSDAVTGINTYASEVSRSVEQQATVAAEQSAAVAEITATMEELSSSSSQIAEHSKSVVSIATGTWENTKKGATAVESVIMKMNEIHEDNQNSTREIVELGRKSREITKVMEIINTIADQTKLIAFNAALEASSAGDSGKRFGVVAVEIRRLADSVMESTGEIESKISEIQEAVNRLVIASEKGSKGIQEGMEYSNQTATLLMELVDAAQSTQESAQQISLSTQQQKTASNQVVIALREIVSGSSQTSDAIKQINSISKKLTQLSDNLTIEIKEFKIN
jgi:methyl-accepting chemotaxis protein